MASQVTIVNRALALLKESAITSISEDTRRAKIANALWTPTAKQVMNMFEWSFTIVREELSALSATPEYGYDYQYQIPNLCIRVLSTNIDSTYDWVVEGDKILTDSDELKIRYIKYIEETGYWTEGFVAEFTTQLAAEMSYPITGRRREREEMYQLYAQIYPWARTHDVKQRNITVDDSTSWLDGRG